MQNAPTKASEAQQAIQTADAQTFIERWQGVTASELSTAYSFVRELCELLGLASPHATPEPGAGRTAHKSGAICARPHYAKVRFGT